MKKTFDQIRNALEEHLSAINDNTTEIQVLFDYLQEVETKVEKLNQRLDKMQMSLDQPLEKTTITPLNNTEKKIFLVLYTEEMNLTAEEIAKKTSLPITVVTECVSFLIQKNIPIHRSFCNQQFFFSLDRQFKELQAKENLINLSLQSFMWFSYWNTSPFLS